MVTTATPTTMTDALWQRYRATGDPEARSQLLDRYLGLVHHVARQVAARDPPGHGEADDQDDEERDRRHGKGEDGHSRRPDAGGQSAAPVGGRQIVAATRAWGLTAPRAVPTIPRLMSAEVPEVLDAWRMAAARRRFEGRLPLSAMARLADLLADPEGEARFALEFGHDALKVPFAELQVDAELPLVCQRSLERFLQPVSLTQRYALVREADGDGEDVEAGLPPGYEVLMVADDGLVRPAALVEDELILAVPLVPAKPGSEPVERDWAVPEEDEQRASPFAALAALKKS